MFGHRLVTYEPNTGCWLWMGHVSSDGYGKAQRGRQTLAHRISYLEAGGVIPDGCEIDHQCRVRSCVNPAHLEPKTHAENVARSIHVRERHRNGRKTHCKRGHPLSGANLAIEGGGIRKCRACRNSAQLERNGGRKGYHGPSKVPLYCKHGHPMFGPDLRMSKGERYCQRCRTQQAARRRAKLKSLEV